MVGLDFRGNRAAGGAFDHVRIERALRKAVDLARCAKKDVDEEISDDFALFFRVLDSRQPAQKALAGVDGLNFNANGRKLRLNLRGLVFSEQTGVDKNAANVDFRFVEQDGQNRGIHAARDAANHVVIADFFANVGDELVLERLHLETRRILRSGQEIAQNLRAFVGVGHFRVKLDAPPTIRPLQRHRRPFLIRGQNFGVIRHLAGVAVTHPNLRFSHAFQQKIAVFRQKRRRAVFPRRPRPDGAAEFEVEQLHAVANAQNRHVEALEVFKIDVRRVFFARAAWPAGQNHGGGFAGFTKLAGLVKPRKIAQFPDPADDELGVLRAEIDDGDGVV